MKSCAKWHIKSARAYRSSSKASPIHYEKETHQNLLCGNIVQSNAAVAQIGRSKTNATIGIIGPDHFECMSSEQNTPDGVSPAEPVLDTPEKLAHKGAARAHRAALPSGTQHKKPIICTCGCGHTHIISEREITLYRGMAVALKKVHAWCVERGVHEFDISDVRPLIGTIEYARFSDWKKFGGLVYSPKGTLKGRYGLNLARCEAFFGGSYKVPARVWKNPITKGLRMEEYKTIDEFPDLWDLVDKNYKFRVTYQDQ